MSIGWVISGLHEGISKSKLSLFSLILKPRLEIILIISFFSILNPVIFSNKEISNLFNVEYQSTILIFKDNKEVYRSIGETSKKEIYKVIKKFI